MKYTVPPDLGFIVTVDGVPHEPGESFDADPDHRDVARYAARGWLEAIEHRRGGGRRDTA